MFADFDFIEIQMPYGLTEDYVNSLEHPSAYEFALWTKGERLKAVKTFSTRTKLDDLALATWMFFTISFFCKQFEKEDGRKT